MELLSDTIKPQTLFLQILKMIRKNCFVNEMMTNTVVNISNCNMPNILFKMQGKNMVFNRCKRFKKLNN